MEIGDLFQKMETSQAQQKVFLVCSTYKMPKHIGVLLSHSLVKRSDMIQILST